MNVVFAANHDEFEKFINDNYCYVGDTKTLACIDPTKVDNILFVGGYDQHPLHLSDELFQFQIDVAKARNEKNGD